MVMTKTTCGEILKFVGLIINTKSFKQKSTDTWIQLNLLKDAYKEYLKTNKPINHRSFVNKLNIISDSNTFALHHKQVWNKIKRVSSPNSDVTSN